MKLRRSTLNETKGNQNQQKALAFALYIKFRVGRNATIKNYTANKLKRLTNLSSTSIKKYIPIIIELGYAKMERGNLILKKLSSDTNDRNICLDNINHNSFKDVYNSIRSYLALLIQHRKNFIKRTIQTATNPHNTKELKAARKTLKRLAKNGIIDNVNGQFIENGISYARIAREIGCCNRTAFSVMAYAIMNNYTRKVRNCEQIQSMGVGYRKVEGATFTTKNNIYFMHANIYALTYNTHLNLQGRRGMA